MNVRLGGQWENQRLGADGIHLSTFRLQPFKALRADAAVEAPKLNRTLGQLGRAPLAGDAEAAALGARGLDGVRIEAAVAFHIAIAIRATLPDVADQDDERAQRASEHAAGEQHGDAKSGKFS